jgi:hypothetical protein
MNVLYESWCGLLQKHLKVAVDGGDPRNSLDRNESGKVSVGKSVHIYTLKLVL